MSSLDPQQTRPNLIGLFYGCLTVLIWSAFNVGSKIGTLDGFRAVDLMVLRFSVGGLVMLPILLFRGRIVPTAPWQLISVLFLAGPAFYLLLTTGFQYGPLSHGIVIGPCMSISVANLLLWKLDGERPTRQRILGICVMLAGLTLIGLEASTETGAAAEGQNILLGDLAFAASGGMYGGYTYLLGRWKMPPLQTAAMITVLSGLIMAPLYLALFEPPALATGKWVEQSVYQGLLGGALAFATFASTVSHLGAARATLFMALVPPTALVLAIPLIGDIPTGLQTAAICLGATGILLSMQTGRLRRRP
ncbi:DMT family transporter [Salipiger sp. P9]|uniref:DMT family transporter n=1 Tax=Salipiger pentaromativorans TaxID=2943193 RepID=UPI0021586C38|nr:DMT family transporter [Salipiger pentaromativorans]MCR8550619.1 DMT family transporter [Salipiger pentaromativorans]